MISKLPWKVLAGWLIVDKDGGSIASTRENDAEFIVAACNAYETNQTQIEQLQAKIYQPGNCYMCKISMENEEWGLIHETDMEEIEQLKAQVEKYKGTLTDIVRQYTTDFTEFELAHDFLCPRERVVLQYAREALEAIEKAPE
jgi:conjugal transfer/entry exclusion protein